MVSMTQVLAQTDSPLRWQEQPCARLDLEGCVINGVSVEKTKQNMLGKQVASLCTKARKKKGMSRLLIQNEDNNARFCLDIQVERRD